MIFKKVPHICQCSSTSYIHNACWSQVSLCNATILTENMPLYFSNSTYQRWYSQRNDYSSRKHFFSFLQSLRVATLNAHNQAPDYYDVFKRPVFRSKSFIRIILVLNWEVTGLYLDRKRTIMTEAFRGFPGTSW